MTVIDTTFDRVFEELRAERAENRAERAEFRAEMRAEMRMLNDRLSQLDARLSQIGFRGAGVLAADDRPCRYTALSLGGELWRR